MKNGPRFPHGPPIRINAEYLFFALLKIAIFTSIEMSLGWRPSEPFLLLSAARKSGTNT